MTDSYPIDFYDYEISIKSAVKNRALAVALDVVRKKYANKQAMVEKGLLSEKAGEKMANEQLVDMAKVYVDHIITGWKGVKYKGKTLAFNKENAVKFFSDEDNYLILGEVIAQSTTQANFIKEQEEAESKNSVKS